MNPLDTAAVAHQEILKNELKARQSINQKYSLRAFAQNLQVSPSFLSLVLSKKRNLSLVQGLAIVEQLTWTRDLKSHFLLDIKNRGATNFVAQPKANKAKREFDIVSLSKPKSKEISPESFSVLSEWWIPVILELLPILGKKANIEEIETKIRVSKSLISRALKILCTLGYAIKIDDYYERTSAEVLEVKPVSSDHIKNYHKQLLSQAYSSVDETGVLSREITSVLIPISKAKFSLVREKIRAFRDDMALIAQDESPNQVCALCIQLFPLTGPES